MTRRSDGRRGGNDRASPHAVQAPLLTHHSAGASAMRSISAVVISLTTTLLFVGSIASAQSAGTVKGRVTGPTGEPLPGATISASGTSRTVTVRSDGTYQITLPPGRYEVRARMPGFAVSADSATVSAATTAVVNFHVQRVATTLETVAILGTRGEQRTVISAPVPIDVLSAADIQ